MKTTHKRTLAFFLCILCVLNLVACTGKTQPAKNQTEAIQSETAQSSEKTDDVSAKTTERQKLTILLAQNTLVEDYDTNRLTKLIEEKANVDLEFVYLPSVDAAEKLSVMINSGEKLPDVVNFNIDKNAMFKYVNQGAFIALDDYIIDGTNMKKYNDLYPEYNILKNITSPDGHIYTIPSFSDVHVSNEVRFKYWINKTWLDALGMEMPTTTEEFYNVLKAFKENDPNGNGKADEIPLIGSTGWSADVNKFLINAFGFCNQGDMWFIHDNKIDVSYAQNFYKEALDYISKLSAENLLDTTSYTMDLTAMKTLINNQDTSLVGCFAYTSNDVISEPDRFTDYVALSPLTGPNGYCGASVVVAMPKPYWFVTADCENPELAFMVGDMLFDEEMYYDERYGEENVNWQWVDDSVVGAYEALGIESKTMITNNIWTESQNTHWRCEQPCVAITAQYSDVYFTEDQCAENPEYARNNLLWDGICEYYMNKADSSVYIGDLSFTEEEIEQIQDIRASLKTFVGEQTVLFATGARNIDEWDDYLAELNEIGLPVFLEICQQAYDRIYG